MSMKLYYAAGIVMTGSGYEKSIPSVFHDLYPANNDDDADRKCINGLMYALAKDGVQGAELHSYTVMEVPSNRGTDLLYGVALLVVRGLDEKTGENEQLGLVCTFSEGDDEEDAIEVSKSYVLEKHGENFSKDNAVIHSAHALPITPENRVLQ